MYDGHRKPKLSLSIYSGYHYPWKQSLYNSLSHLVSLQFLYLHSAGATKVYPFWFPDRRESPISRILRFLASRPRVYVCLDSDDVFSLALFFYFRMMRSRVIFVVAENQLIYARQNRVVYLLSRMKKMANIHLLRHSDFLIAESYETYRFLLELGCDRKKIQVLLHGVDLSKFHPSGKRTRAPKDRLRVLFAGGLLESKGYKYLLEAIGTGKLVNLDFVFLTLGKKLDPKERPNVPHITWMDRVTNDEMVGLYQRADVVMVPSVATDVDAERSPNVVIEAMACGCAVVATRVGGIPSYVGDAGILIRSRDSQEIVNALLTLQGNPELLQNLKAKAGQRALATFDIEQYANALLGLSTVVNSHGKEVP